MSKIEVTFEAASTKNATHLLRLWVNRSEALDMATRIINAMRDPNKEEVGFSLFVKEEIEQGE